MRGLATVLPVAVLGAGLMVVPVPPSYAKDDQAWTGWTSSPDGAKLAPAIPVGDPVTRTIQVDPSRPLQLWLGVGGGMTDSSVQNLQANRDLQKLLFDPDTPDGAHLNLIRLPMSATDFSSNDWSFDTVLGPIRPPKEATAAVAQVLAAKRLRADLHVVGLPWSAPASMKTTSRLEGGALAPGAEAAFAAQLVSQASWLKRQGVPLTAISIANEPGFQTRNYPTMKVTDEQLAAIASRVSGRLRAQRIGLWAVDHNWEDRGRVDEALRLSGKAYTAAAFHCYRGDSTQMVGLAIPAVVTECTGETAKPTEDQAAADRGTFAWDARELVVRSIESGSTGLFMWNLALDEKHGPRTYTQCPRCRGMVTVGDKKSLTREPEFWAAAHLSRAAEPGARVLTTEHPGNLQAVAFAQPSSDAIGVFGQNDTNSSQVVNVVVKGAGERRFRVGPHELFTFRGRPGTPEEAHPDYAGKIVRGPDSRRYFVDEAHVRHYIGTASAFECNGGKANTIRVSQVDIDAMPEGDHADCPFPALAGEMVRGPKGDVYVLDRTGKQLTRHWVPSAADYVCARAEGGNDGRRIVAVGQAQLDQIPSGAARPGGNCIVRGSGGDAHFVNNEGQREWVPDSPTWDCEVGRGVPVRNVSADFVKGVNEVGWHYCLNKANLRNKMLRHSDGDVNFIHADDTKTWIPDAATYSCRVNAGFPVVQTRWRQYVDAFRGREWDYCYDVRTLVGKIITHPNGDSHYVDEEGVRHWIRTQGTYQCLRARGIPAETVRWRQYIDRTPEGEWAICGNTLAMNQKLDRGQWLQSNNGRYRLHMQGDGNFAAYNAAGSAIWATNRYGQFAIVQSDGNLVEYGSGGAMWASNTVGSKDNRLVMQDDGNVVLYSATGAVWASNTVGR